MSPALGAYLLATRLLAPVGSALIQRRLGRGKEDPERWPERLGHTSLPRPAGRLVWLHGASVGEAMSMLPLIEALRARDVQVLATTGTLTSARRLTPLLPAGALHQFVPIDTAPAVARFLDHWRPDLGIWIESELWPRLVHAMAATGRPMAMVNARISATSARNWSRAPGMARRLLGAFDLIEAQDDETVGRLTRLGARSVRNGGNLKTLVPVPEVDAEALDTLRQAIGGRPVWLAASTHEGEERAVLEAHLAARKDHPDLLTILAPRHPERGVALIRDLNVWWQDNAQTPLRLVQRSAAYPLNPDTDVLLADTLGEMGLWYRLAPIAFVGGSLIARGGHTPFEPIPLGVAVLHGPHVENFAPAYAALSNGGGACTITAADLGRNVATLLTDAPAREAMVTRAQAIHTALRPDVEALADRLLALGGA